MERRLKEVISVFSNEMWVKAREGCKVIQGKANSLMQLEGISKSKKAKPDETELDKG